MKRLVVITVLLLAGNCFAQDKVDIEKACGDKAKLAAKIMDGRHTGMPMGEAMAIALKHNNSIMEKMIIEAYDHPKMHSPEMVKMSISDFGDRWYGKCYKALSSVKQ